MARDMVDGRPISIRLTCQVIFISQNCYRYQPKHPSVNVEIADLMIRLTYNPRCWGFGLCFLFLGKVRGFRRNHKRVFRIYRELELTVRITPKTRIVRKVPEPLVVSTAMNETWSMGFMHDGLLCGRSYRLLNVNDDYNWQGLGIELDFTLPSERVIRSLALIIECRGKPNVVRCDNGPKYISHILRAWAEKHRIWIQHIQPRKPHQNAYVERHNRTVRYDWLNQYQFGRIDRVPEYATRWL